MNLLIGLLTMIVCLAIQALLLVFTLHYHMRYRHRFAEGRFGVGVLIISGVMVVLVVGNLIQVGLWAGVFYWLGEFPMFEEAFYHSAVNFATLGYGDIVMSDAHRMLGPLEAINGVLMIGVSTAMLMAAIQDAIRRYPTGNHTDA